MSSAYKRHGFILEHAILERLKQCSRYRVWDDRTFAVPQGADHVVAGAIRDPQSLIGVEHPYGQPDRTIQVDLLVFDRDRKNISAYEIKRGTGLHDAGKRRSILRDLLCTQILLKSYAKKVHDLDAVQAESKIIFYYGKKSIDPPFSLQREELDEHFGFDVVRPVEEINNVYRERLAELIALVGHDTDIEVAIEPSDDVVDLSQLDMEADGGPVDVIGSRKPERARRIGWSKWLFGRN